MDFARLIIKHRNLLFFEYFAVFVILIYAGNTTKFTNAEENWDHPIGMMLPIVTMAILAFNKGIRFNHKYILLLFGFITYFVATTIYFGQIHPRFFGIYIIKFTEVYIIITALGFRFFKILETVMFYLCIIAIVFWVILNLIPNTFIEFLRPFEFSTQGNVKGNVDFNVLIYTIGNYTLFPDSIVNFGSFPLIRNSGFCWEPGVFASFVNVAIFFNLIRNRFKLRNNKYLIVFIIALASTLSTTGYSLFILLLMFYLYNQSYYKAVWLAPVFAVLAFGLSTLPFMSEKVKSDNKLSTEELVYRSAKYNLPFSPQRFQSLEIDFIDFLNYPITGYGGHMNATWTAKIGANITTISGIGELISQFGLVGIIYFLTSLWISSTNIISLYNIRGTLFPVLFILLYAISYSVLSIFIMTIWMLPLAGFRKTKVIRKFTLNNVIEA
jgi:hypothetical protein